jgi:hypothetical protein
MQSNKRMVFGLLALAVSLGLAAVVQAQQAPMTFFISSVSKGNGADLGGLDGADAHCNALAKAAARRSATGAPT